MKARNARGIVALTVASLLVAATPGQSAMIEDVEFSDELKLGDEELALRGTALLRYRVFFRAYVAALYLPADSPLDDALRDEPRRLEIEYFWSIPATGFRQATLDGIEKNVDAATWQRLRPKIDRFNELYSDVEPGDRYQLTYLPGVGTELALNGKSRGSVDGADFAKALFSIWLGAQPFDISLKNQLLGIQ